jgi:hypothetical protein
MLLFTEIEMCYLTTYFYQHFFMYVCHAIVKKNKIL